MVFSTKKGPFVIRVSVLTSALLALLFSLVMVSFASALEAIDVKANVEVLDLSAVAEDYEGDGDRLQVSTAPGPDGIVRRIEVRARQSGAIPGWVVFALANKTDQQVDRYLVVPHFRMSGSGLLKPDLGAQRVASISTSQGFAPERIRDAEADVFRVTLDPGNVVTFVLEKSHRKLPGLTLWEPEAYKNYVNSYTFFRGIVLGISGLLALFLVILFVVKGAAMFPAAALLAWSVLAYLAIDFGFMGYLFDISTASEPAWRAAAEVVFSASILILLFTYLTLHRWHVRYLHISSIWLIFLIVVLGLALFDPSLGAGIARLSMVVTACSGFAVILYLAFTGFDRAIMLIPTWILLLLWLLASGAAVLGILTNDLVQPALSGGLVLLVLLFSFTIMQHAFSGGILAQGIVSDSERRALAIVGSGDMVWDWDIPRDHIHTSGEAEKLLGLKRGALDGHARDWLEILHPQDRDRFTSMLDAVIDQRRGRVNQDFRLRADDGHYRWFKLRIRPVVGTDGEVVRCVGTLLDITDQRTAEERMLHDAVHDNLTGLANRELLQDRLDMAMTRTKVEGVAKPAVILVDIDDFRAINDNYGLSIGDSILLTVARRLNRILKAQDSIARFYGDQFAIILLSEQEPERIAVFADNVRKQLRDPIVFGDKELTLKTSIGISIYDPQIHMQAGEVIYDSELALYHAKRLGGDRIEPFRPSLRQQGRSRGPLDKDLVAALEKNEIDVVFQPIVSLHDRQIKGFEALARWNHAQRGNVPPADFIPAAERTGLIVPLGITIMEQAAHQLSAWQQKYEGMEQLFMSVNVSSQQLLRHDLINDVKMVLSRSNVTRGTLKLELTESLVMENPEYASQVLDKLRNMGAGLSLDDFGTGYSSLSYLQHFPFDTLKIDKSFIGQMSGVTNVILGSIVQLAHDLDLNLVAEGVETEESVEQLMDMGCPLAQGFLFGKPLLASDADQMLQIQQEQHKAAQASAEAKRVADERATAARLAAEKQREQEAKRAAEAAELERAQAHARKVAAQPLPAEKPAEKSAQKPAPTDKGEGDKAAMPAEKAEVAASGADRKKQEPAKTDSTKPDAPKQADAKPEAAPQAKINEEALNAAMGQALESAVNEAAMELALESAITKAATEAVSNQQASSGEKAASEKTPAPAKPEEKKPIPAEMPKSASESGTGSDTGAKTKTGKKERKFKKPGFLKSAVEAAGNAANVAVSAAKQSATNLKDATDKVAEVSKMGKGKEAAPQAPQQPPALPQEARLQRPAQQGQPVPTAQQATPGQVPTQSQMPARGTVPPQAPNQPQPQGHPQPQAYAQAQAQAQAKGRPPHMQQQQPSQQAPRPQQPMQPHSGHPVPQQQHDGKIVPPHAAGQAPQAAPAVQARPVQPAVQPQPQVPSQAPAQPPAPARPAPQGQQPQAPAAPQAPVQTQPVSGPAKPAVPAGNQSQQPSQPSAAPSPSKGKAVPAKEKPADDSDLPFAMPDMSGIDQDIANAIANAMKGSQKKKD